MTPSQQLFLTIIDYNFGTSVVLVPERAILRVVALVAYKGQWGKNKKQIHEPLRSSSALTGLTCFSASHSCFQGSDALRVARLAPRSPVGAVSHPPVVSGYYRKANHVANCEERKRDRFVAKYYAGCWQLCLKSKDSATEQVIESGLTS